VGEPDKGSKIIEPILIEVRKADDKLLLVELYLLESKINYKVRNYAKAKASLTASRANANNVYCQPSIIAEIDLVSGILYAQDQDYKTSYSYFYEALEPLMYLWAHSAQRGTPGRSSASSTCSCARS
jgi:26S proteasome regulatory subunit N6